MDLDRVWPPRPPAGERLEIISAVDGPADFPRDFSVYLHIPPFNGKAIFPNDTFWALVESAAKGAGGE